MTPIATPPQQAVPVLVTETSPAPYRFEAHYETRPNLVVVVAGAVTFGISYGMAAIAGGVSTHQGDDHLFVPVVGPWLDFADRGSCGMTGVTSCSLERGNKIGVVIDGVFQDVGVLAIIAGFVFRERREVRAIAGAAAPTLQLAPVRYVHGGIGLAAMGTF